MPSVAPASRHREASVGGKRRRTTRIGAPQHGQAKGGRGLTQAKLGTPFNTTCINAIKVLLLGCS